MILSSLEVDDSSNCGEGEEDGKDIDWKRT